MMKILYLKNQNEKKGVYHFSIVILSLITSFLISFSAISQNIGINPSGALPDASAMLDVESNDKGLLVPRLTTSERDAIQNPAMSLLIFNTQTECFEAWNSNTSNWVSFGCIGCYLPTVPTANAGTNIQSTDFDANWSASSGVTTYYLDVATDSTFTNFIINNQNVGNVTTYNVTGLTCETDYYYRVRAENVCGTTISSNVELVTAGSCCSSGTITFNYTGSPEQWTVPSPCNNYVTIEAWGAQGGNGGPTTSGMGGLGGYSKADILVTPGEVLNIYVGEQGQSQILSAVTGGWNGGGGTNASSNDNKRPGCGGGASDVRRVGSTLNDRIIVAGGGGGAGGWETTNGGAGGGLTGGNGGGNWSVNGKGGTQSAGGAGNNVGSLGVGGRGQGGSHGGGGGGGGWYGGGGGYVDAGGGGSGYVAAPGNTNTSMQSGVQTGDGKVTITW